MTFFTSDTHFGHANILTYCNRPFRDLQDMEQKMIERWNDRVSPDDQVYHLGDFAMGKKENIFLRKKLNGKIILIRGNHDRSADVMRGAGFDEVYNSLTVQVDGYTLYLAHIPKHVPDPTNRGYSPSLLPAIPEHDYFICGHVHQQWGRIGNTINAGVDLSDYRPLTLSELLTRDQ